MELLLFMTVAAALIGVMGYKLGKYDGYDAACEEILEELKEADDRLAQLRTKSM